MRLTGLGEEKRSDVSHLTLAPLERLFLVITRKPWCEGKSCVRICAYYFFLLLICIYILLYLLLHALHAGSFPLSEISIRALGLTPGLDHPSFHSQVYPRVEGRCRTVVRVHGW